MLTKIIKRDGTTEDFIPSKLNKWAEWAAGNLGHRVDWSGIVTEAIRNLGESSTSEKLQAMLVKLCVKRKDWPHNLMAGRLYAATLHKKIHGDNIPTVKDFWKKLQKSGLVRELNYTDEEWAEINEIIDHKKDFKLAYFQIQQNKKYSIQNRATKKSYETPQFTYMRMAMALAEDEKTDKILHLRNWYEHFSENRINAPTPNYINLGTNHNGYASCCLIISADNEPSLAIADHIARRMTGMSAGIGSLIDCRSINDKVRGGSLEHQGKLPYYKARAGAVKANMQAGRGGACTEYYSGYDPESSVISQLQNPRSTEDKKNRDLHFAMISNSFFGKKAAKNEDVFTFTSRSCPDLWEAMFSGDIKNFERIYNQYENDTHFKKDYINARDFIINCLVQSYEVGTHYLAFIDEMNRHTPYIEPIYSSNLCTEITQPTAPYLNMMDLYSERDSGYIEFENFSGSVEKLPWSSKIYGKNGRETFAGNLKEGIDVKKIIKKVPTPEVSLCSLFGIIECNIKSDEQYRSAVYYGLKMVDKCINMSDYPLTNVGWTAKKRMNAGVGLLGIAYSLARKGLKYDTQEGYDECHRIAERHSFFLIEQSLKIAKERGLPEWIHKTKWPDGWLPIDTYKKTVDNITNVPLQYDWESLRRDIINFGGIGHSSLVAHMPTESSSKAAGVPNGLYPIRDFDLKKSDQSNIIDWVAIDGDILEDQYQLAWNIPTKALIKTYAVFQKFADQAPSADTYKDRTSGMELSSKEMLEEYLDMIRYGMKTRYYQNSLTSSQNKNTAKKEVCTSGACDV